MSDDAIAGEAAPADPPPQALAPVQPVQRPDPTTLLLFLGSLALKATCLETW